MSQVRTGLDRILQDGLPAPGRGRVALLCNATSVSSDWVPTADAVSGIPGLRLKRIFSPQHGFASEKQDNMIASADGVHPHLGVPILSLYGEKREPAPADLEGLDLVLIDLPDVGCRVYTFLVTASHVIHVAAGLGLPVVILDRPNPIGGDLDGPVLEEGFESFVGLTDVPLRHGLTAGEFCLYAARKRGDVDTVSVIAAEGWRRDQYADEIGLPWTMPSPNLPTLDTAIVYPGQVIWEGTRLSEGRGTTRPFEIFGAPFLDPARVQSILEGRAGHLSAGLRLREVAFEPTFHKHAGHLCRGFFMHVLDRRTYRPVAAAVSLLWAIHEAHPDEPLWRPPPYEYEAIRAPIDLLFGTDRVRRAIEEGAEPNEIISSWDADLAAYRERRVPALVYPE